MNPDNYWKASVSIGGRCNTTGDVIVRAREADVANIGTYLRKRQSSDRGGIS